MSSADDPTTTSDRFARCITSLTTVGRMPILVALGLSIFVVDPALAQSPGTAFCETDMAQTIKNIFTLIQFGGPLIGGVIALGATVFMPVVRRSDIKRELKEARNQGLVWGVIVAPLGTTAISFLLNYVVAGGTSCGF